MNKWEDGSGERFTLSGEVYFPYPKERPILFKAEMVVAILQGRKTQTRRTVKMPNDWNAIEYSNNSYGPSYISQDGRVKSIPNPYGNKGDRLWVKETWGAGTRPDPINGCIDGFEYKADELLIGPDDDLPIYPNETFEFSVVKTGWRSALFMPRAASRITLEIEAVRIERLHQITEADARKEGFKNRDAFGKYWQQIQRIDFDMVDPLVWVLTFKKV